MKLKRTNIKKSPEEEQQDNQIQKSSGGNETIKQYAWALHHFFPDTVPSQRLPDYLVYPTHIFSTAFERVIKVGLDGRFVIYWNPAITVQTVGLIGTGGVVNTTHYMDSGQPLPSNNCYITYSDTTPPLPSANIIVLGQSNNPPTTGPYYLRNLEKISASSNIQVASSAETAFNRLRLLSAYMEITYVGKDIDMAGFIKAGLNTLRYGSNFASDGSTLTQGTANLIDISLINTYPVYKVFKTDKTISLFYRITDDTLFNFGPYDSTIDFPYYLVSGESLTPGSSIFVRVVRTFEGVLKPSQNELCNPQTESTGIIGTKQHEVMSRMLKDLPPILAKDDYIGFKKQLFND